MAVNRTNRRKSAGPTALNVDVDLQAQLLEFLDLQSAWYQGWYFLARADDEISRTRKVRGQMSVLCLSFPSLASVGNEDRQDLEDVLEWIASHDLRSTDLPATLSEAGQQYAVLMPHTDARGAEVVARRLALQLQPFAPVMSIAAYPRDGKDVKELLAGAQPYEQPVPDNVIPFLPRKLLAERRRAIGEGLRRS